MYYKRVGRDSQSGLLRWKLLDSIYVFKQNVYEVCNFVERGMLKCDSRKARAQKSDYLEAQGQRMHLWFSHRRLIRKLNGWKILINDLPEREDLIMSRGEIYIECPKFGGEQNLWGDKARRDYAHSLDSTIIKFLDNPVINSIFRHLVEMMADSTWGSVVASGVEILLFRVRCRG